MTRVKRGTSANKRKKSVLKSAKGFKWGRKSKYKLAKDALQHAWTYSYRDRKTKKREFRKLWQIKISAFCKRNGINYSQLIHNLKEENIDLDRKILAEMVEKYPSILKEIIKKAKDKTSKIKPDTEAKTKPKETKKVINEK